MVQHRLGARGSRSAKRINRDERNRDSLYERGVLTKPGDRMPRIPANALIIDDEFQSLIPPQTPEENTALEESLLRDGCNDALVIWQGHNTLIDGHHRYAICQKHGIAYTTRELSFDSREDVIVWMVQHQLARRNVSAFVRSSLAIRMKAAFEAKAKANQLGGLKRGDEPAVRQNSDERETSLRTDESVAEMANVSRDTIRKVENITRNAPAPIVAKARSGEISVNRADLLVKALKGASEAVINFVAKHNIDEPKKIAILIRLEKSAGSLTTNGTFDEIIINGGFHYGTGKKQYCNFITDTVEQIEAALAVISEQHKRMALDAKKAEREAIPDDMPKHDDRYTLFTGDYVTALAGIPDFSIDVIITDPPYGADSVDAYEQLALSACRLLKPGGSLLAMCGQFALPETLWRMSQHLDYHWTLAYLTPGGQSPQIFPRKVNTFWKPVLWFTAGEYKDAWVGDVIRSAVNDNDKRFHHWGQSESGMAELIEKFSRAGDTILDPFLGGGTTAVVALKLNRKVIGVDINADCVETTRERIEEWLTNLK